MSAASHPRRRPARPIDLTMALIDSFQNMSIRKSDTFHPNTNTGADSFWDPLQKRAESPHIPMMRSSTSPKSLEDLLIGSGERRVTELLNRVDEAVAAKSKVALENVLNEPEVLPLPDGVVDQAVLPERSPETRARDHRHSSDSGLGSSIAGSVEFSSGAKDTPTTSRSAPTTAKQSFFSISHAVSEQRSLSKYAADQIHCHIVTPILNEESLKDFHGLIKSVPSRIGDNEIKTLRDLEKTLIFLAPDYARSPSIYLRFCERTIRVLHTTVTTLHESDQKAPSDRPYTQGYFFDLVEQIRRYATILAAKRASHERSEQSNAMDIAADAPHVSLHGGIHQNRKPAELVHHTADGKVISLATDQQISDDELATATLVKRPAIDFHEEDAVRSMARRKKNGLPEIHKCDFCSKEFRRPCDLKKHVMTHVRPFKCPETECKYHVTGWPTQKELDRHCNDKHNPDAKKFPCLFCPWGAIRQSNLKQHMEKCHGWHYVRLKGKPKNQETAIHPVPQASVPPSPASAMHTPPTPAAPSPSTHPESHSSRQSSVSMAPPPASGPSHHNTSFISTPSSDFTGHFNMSYTTDFSFNDLLNHPSFPTTPATSDETHDSVSPSPPSGVMLHGFSDTSPTSGVMLDSFTDTLPSHFAFDNSDFALPGDWQLHSPKSSVKGHDSAAAPPSPDFKWEQTFTDDAIMNGYGDYPAKGPSQDFTLFGDDVPAATSGDMCPALALSAQGAMGDASSYGAIDFDPPALVKHDTPQALARGAMDEANSFDAMDFDPPALVKDDTNQALAELFPELQETRSD